MDPLAFLSWQFVMFSLFVATIMYVLRTCLEYFFPRLKTVDIWNSLMLMILPIAIGGTMGGLLKMYPYATGFTTITEHVGYGAVAGLLSTILFKVVKELLIGKINGAIGTVLTAVGVNTTTTTTVGISPPCNSPNVTPPPGSMMRSEKLPSSPAETNKQ